MEKYIGRCYESLLSQQDAVDVEFIFVNDGSSDETLQILKKYSEKDKRVIIIDQINSGVSAARNRALEMVSGSYFFLLDSDDYLPLNTISNIKKIVNKYQPDIIMPAYNRCINGNKRFVRLPLTDGLYDKYSFFEKVAYFPTIPQLVYKKQPKHDLIRFDESIKCGEVYTFTISYLQYAQYIYVLNTACYNYFQRLDSATNKPNYKNDFTVVNALEQIYKQGGELRKYSSFCVTAFKLFMSFTYNKYLRFPFCQDSIDVVEKLFSVPIILRNIKDVLFKPHTSFKERSLACYVFLMPTQLGFKILNKIICKLEYK